MYCSFAIIGHAVMVCSTVSSDCLQSLHLLSVSVLFILVAQYLVVMPDRLLMLLNFQSLLSHLPSAAIGTVFFQINYLYLKFTGHALLYFHIFC